MVSLFCEPTYYTETYACMINKIYQATLARVMINK